MWIPVENDWRLNERHYGGLQGLNKAETAAKFGEQQVMVWRRSYDVPPPPLTRDDPRYPGLEPRYRGLTEAELPLTESLKETVARFMPLWTKVLAPAVKRGERLIIAAHGNSLRALVKYLDGISDADIVGLNIPTGVPLVYELDDESKAHPPLLSRRRGGNQAGCHRPWRTRARRDRRTGNRPDPGCAVAAWRALPSPPFCSLPLRRAERAKRRTHGTSRQ